jgi:putative membrane protein
MTTAAQALEDHQTLSSENKEVRSMTLRQSSREISFIAILLLAGATAFAQQPQPGGAQQSSPAQQQPGQANNPNSALANADASGPSTPNFADQAFVEDTLKDNQALLQMSQLAQQKASSGDVKEFSQHMIQIHTQLNQQLAPLAKQLDVSANQKPSKQEKKEIAQLEQLSGPDFDTAYIQAMAKEQQHSLKEFKNEESAQNPMIQKATKIDEPVLTQHFQILQKIAQTHNVPLDAKE